MIQVPCLPAVLVAGSAAESAATPDRPLLQLGALVAAIAFLGVPHGALDIVYASRQFRLNRLVSWGLFLLGYLAVAALVLLAWWAAPGLTLAGFLLLSAFHFAGDLDSGAGWLLRSGHGLALISMPALGHGEVLTSLFAALVPSGSAELLVSALAVIAPAVGALLAAGFADLWRRSRSSSDRRRLAMTGLEVLVSTALVLLVDPLLAFTLYFCGLHSARHVARTRRLLSLTPSRLLLVALPPTVGSLLAAAAAFALLGSPTADIGLLRVTFVGLAALTVPHMLLVEPQLRPRT